MSQFSLAFRKMHFMDGPAGDCIALDFEIENVARRTATILSQEFELWLVTNPSNYAKRLAVLGSDIRGRLTETGAQVTSKFGENQKSPMRLLWHFTPEQLQWIEEVRNGGDPVFELRGLVTVQFVTIQNFGDTSKHIEYEMPRGVTGGWPYQFPISESTWLALLDRIGFKHIIYTRLKWPVLPPAFQNSQRNLDDAWKHFREGQTDSVLVSCFKAFECLGFNLFADEKLQRRELIDLLMQGAQPEKRDAAHAILRNLQQFFHFGRHERGPKIDIDRNDAEMALVCATALLAYLGPYYVPAGAKMPPYKP